MSDHDSSDDAAAPDDQPRPPTREAQVEAIGGDSDADLGRRGWLLVAVVVISFLVVPGTILVNPPSIPFRVAFLVLPLVPAVLLGATAVWVALRRGPE